MDVRGRRLRKQSDETAAFTSSMVFDGRIAARVIEVNMAHMVSLVEGGSVSKKVGAKCLSFLASTSSEIQAEGASEDIHQVLEQRAVDSLGVDVAGYLNLGKSRNDQVATAIRMEMREAIVAVLGEIGSLQSAVLEVARGQGRSVMPGYTHLQRAQPVTFGHHFLAYFDSLQRDLDRFLQLYRRVNLSPMGSAALAGTAVPLDRGRTAELLGFSGVVANAMDAVSSRDVVVEAISCALMTMIDLSRLCEEIVLWSSKEFGFVELADEYSASSSIMPQKKNPVVAEVARAKCGSVLGSLTAVSAILKALPYSYNLDLQETTPHLWRALDDTRASLRAVAGMISTMKLSPRTAEMSVEGDYSTATALADFLVREHGVSFRQAHAIVGELVRSSLKSGVPFDQTVASDIMGVSSRLARSISLDLTTARRVLSPEGFLSGITTAGGSNPRFLGAEVSARSKSLGRRRAEVSSLAASLKGYRSKLGITAKAKAREVKN